MPDPCIQESRVCTLESALEVISESLVELKGVARETYKVLADISRQGAEISAMATRLDKYERSFEQLSERIRNMDETLGVHSSFVRQYDKDQTKGNTVRSSVLAGLTVAAVVAFVSFLFFASGQLKYVQQSAQPQQPQQQHSGEKP